jgi:hypothetical protein
MDCVWTDPTAADYTADFVWGLIEGGGYNLDALMRLTSSGTLLFGYGGHQVAVPGIGVFNYDDGTDWELGLLYWGANKFIIGTSAGGAGTDRSLQFVVGGVDAWSINANKHLVPSADGNFQFGTSSKRPSIIYAATSFTVGTNPSTTGQFKMPSGGTLHSRNSLNNGNTQLIKSNATHDAVELGDTNVPAILPYTKTDTGDPTGAEGMHVINTFDDVYKIYADGAWRTVTSW